MTAESPLSLLPVDVVNLIASFLTVEAHVGAREVTTMEGRDLASSMGMPYVEISAKSAEDVLQGTSPPCRIHALVCETRMHMLSYACVCVCDGV